jgi:hypothetical protein
MEFESTVMTAFHSMINGVSRDQINIYNFSDQSTESIASKSGSSVRSSRFNPVASPSRRRKRASPSDSSGDDDGPEIGPTEARVDSRREATRRQRIESEQRRRDELRDAYRLVKDALPASNQKASKVSLLERGKASTVLPIDRNQTNSVSQPPTIFAISRR